MRIRDIFKKFQKPRAFKYKNNEEVRKSSPVPQEKKIPARQSAPAPSDHGEEAKRRTAMTNEEKIRAIEDLLNMPDHDGHDFFLAFYNLMERMDAFKYNYNLYITNFQKDIQSVSEADYDKCAAMLTALYREDYYDNGSFSMRCRQGTVEAFLRRMAVLLEENA